MRPEIIDGNRRRAAVEYLRTADVVLPTFSELADPDADPDRDREQSRLRRPG